MSEAIQAISTTVGQQRADVHMHLFGPEAKRDTIWRLMAWAAVWEPLVQGVFGWLGFEFAVLAQAVVLLAPLLAAIGYRRPFPLDRLLTTVIRISLAQAGFFGLRLLVEGANALFSQPSARAPDVGWVTAAVLCLAWTASLALVPVAHVCIRRLCHAGP